MFDTIIRNASIYNGCNEAPFQADIAISGDRIAKIGDLSQAQAVQEIDASGLMLTPGFIDPHASTGFGYFFPNAADHKLFQGISTEIFGNCGTSTAPIGPNLLETLNKLANDIGFPFEWRSLEEYFEQVEENLQFNIATLVGHSTLRGGVLSDWNQCSNDELDDMKSALAQAMDEGALGMSTGLIYAPGCFAETKEIIELAKVVQKKGGLYASHIRDERDKIEEAVEEALSIGKEANINVLVSHLKAAEKQNWGKIPKILERLERFNEENELEVRVDVYPYTAVSTKLRAFIPKHYLQDGIEHLPKKLAENPNSVQEIADWIVQRDYGLDKMLIISDDHPAYANKTVEQIAKDQKQTAAEAIVEMLQFKPDMWIVYHCISEEDMDAAILWKNAMICTDSWSYPVNAPTTIGQPHPRSYGAFTEYLQRYVLEQKSLTWEEAIHKITQMPAQFFGVQERGEIREGFYADINLFEAENIRANASYSNPRQHSSGLVHLWVNGKQVIQNSKITDNKSGVVIKKEHEAVSI